MEEAGSLDEAVALLETWVDNSTFGTGGALVHLADFNKNKIAKIQIRSRVIQVTYGSHPPGGDNGTAYVGSANHYTSDFYSRPGYEYESSFARYDRLMQLLETSTGAFDIDRCWAILKDTSGGDATNNTISRIAENSSQSKTVFSNIFTPEGMYYGLLAPHLYFATYQEPQFVGPPDDPGMTLVDSLAAERMGPFTGIAWTTAAQAPLSRFNIYRSRHRDGGYRRINLLPVWARQKAGERPYRFFDLTAAGRPFYYRVETLERGGLSIMSGPVQLGK
jgi:hypothetical protein